MTTAVETFKEVLQDGEWKNFNDSVGEREVPGINILYKDDRRRYMNHGINLTPEAYSPDYTFAGTKIISDRSIFVELYAKKEKIRNALFDDLEDIIKDSSYDIILSDVRNFEYKNRYRVECTARILI